MTEQKKEISTNPKSKRWNKIGKIALNLAAVAITVLTAGKIKGK